MDGGAIEKLCKVMGHCSVVVTERYAHLRPDAFTEQDQRHACVDLSPGGEVVELHSKTAMKPVQACSQKRSQKQIGRDG